MHGGLPWEATEGGGLRDFTGNGLLEHLNTRILGGNFGLVLERSDGDFGFYWCETRIIIYEKMIYAQGMQGLEQPIKERMHILGWVQFEFLKSKI